MQLYAEASLGSSFASELDSQFWSQLCRAALALQFGNPSFTLAASECSFQMHLGSLDGQLSAFSFQDAASEWSFGLQLGSLELSLAALRSLAAYLLTSLGKKLAACKAVFAACSFSSG